MILYTFHHLSILILILLPIQLISICLEYSESNPLKCKTCDYLSYNSDYLYGREFDSCYPRIITSKYIKTIFMKSIKNCNTLLNCDGSIENPFHNLGNALISESLKINKEFTDSIIIFKFFKGDYLISKNDFGDNIINLFRGTNIEIILEPVFCSIYGNINDCVDSEEKIKIICEIYNVFFYISKSMTINNIIFEGVNSIFDQFLFCKFSNEKCCAENTDCLIEEINFPIDLFLKNSKGFFNLEPIFDNEKNMIPNILINNSDFINFNNLYNFNSFYSLIIFDSFQVNITISNCIFVENKYILGIIIKKNLVDLSKYVQYNLLVNKTNIFINNSMFNHYISSELVKNNLNPSCFDTVFFGLCEFNGNFTISNSILKNNSIKTFNFFNIINQKISQFNVKLIKNLFQDNNANSILYSYSNYNDINTKFIEFNNNDFNNNNLNNFITLYYLSNFKLNGYFKDFILPFDSFIISYFSNITLENCNFLNISYYEIQKFLFEFNSIYITEDPAFLSHKKSFYYANESLVISNCYFFKMKVLFAKTVTFANSIKIYNSIFKNLEFFVDYFIFFNPENIFELKNVSFFNISAYKSIIYVRMLIKLEITNLKSENITIYADNVYFLAAITKTATDFNTKIDNCVFKNIKIQADPEDGTKYAVLRLSSKQTGVGFNSNLTNIYFESIEISITKISNMIIHLNTNNQYGVNITFNNIKNCIAYSYSPRADKTILYMYGFLVYNSYVISRIFHCNDVYIDKAFIENAVFYFDTLNDRNVIYIISSGVLNIKNVTIIGWGEVGTFIVFQINNIINLNINFLILKNFENSGLGFLAISTATKNQNWLNNLTIFPNNYGIINSIFENSYGNSVIFLLPSSEILLRNCTFKNINSIEGGIINLMVDSQALCHKINIFVSNSIQAGGSFYLSNALLFLSEATINNSNSLFNGGIISTTNSILILKNSSFNKGFANFKGGFIFVENTKTYIFDTYFNDSKTNEFGGHICTQGGELYINNSMFFYGLSSLFGGSLFIQNTLLIVYKCNFISNMANLGIFYISGSEQLKNNINLTNFQNNFILQSGLIYMNEVDLFITNIFFNENLLNSGALFEVYGLTLKPEFILSDSNILNNTAFKLFISYDSVIILKNTNILENSIKGNFFKLKSLSINLINTLLILKKNNKTNSILLYSYLWDAKNIISNISDSNFELFHLTSFYFGLNCIINLNNTNIYNGKNKYGSIFNLQESFLNAENNTFKNSEAEKGSTIYCLGCEIFLKNSNFVNNSGETDIDINEFKEIGFLKLENSIFINSSKNIIFIRKINFLFENSSSYCSNDRSQYCQILNSDDSKLINISNSQFFNCFNLSCFYVKNSKLMPIDIIFKNNIFEKSKSDFGNFLYIKGDSNLNIYNTSFINGMAIEGGAILYDCITENFCFFKLENSTFKDNYAELKGGGIQSYSSNIIQKNNLFLNNDAKSGKEISFYPSKLIAFFSEDHELLVNYTNGLINNFTKLTESELINNIPDKINLIINNISMIPGYKYQISAIILDDLGTIQNTENNQNLLLSTEKKNETNETLDNTLRNNLAISNKGRVVFEDVIFSGHTGESNEIFFFYQSSHSFYSNLTLFSKYCNIGDSFYDFMCVQCPKNKFSYSNFSICEDCPFNSYCPGGNKIIPDPNFWIKDSKTKKIVKCLSENACKSYAEFITIDDFQCNDGYKGNYCGVCDKEYGKSQDDCVNCGKNKSLYIFVFMSGIIFIIFYCKWQEFIIFRSKSGDQSSLFLTKIFQNHLSTFVVINAIGSDWSASLKNFFNYSMSYFSTSPTAIYSYDCFFSDIDEETLLSTSLFITGLLPICIVFFMILFKFIQEIIIILKSKKKQDIIFNSSNKKKLIFEWFHHELIKYLSLIYFNCNTQILAQFLRNFQCINVDDTSDTYIKNFPFTRCYSEFYYKLVLISVLFITFWSLLIPLYIFNYIRIKRKNKTEEKQDFVVAFVLRGLKEEYYFWELIILIRKNLILFLVTWAHDLDTISVGAIAIMFYFIFLILNEKCKPFISNKILAMERFSLFIIIYTLGFTIIASFDDIMTGVKTFFIVGILVINLIFLFVWIKSYLSKIIEKIRNSNILQKSFKSRFSIVSSKKIKNTRIKNIKLKENK